MAEEKVEEKTEAKDAAKSEAPKAHPRKRAPRARKEAAQEAPAAAEAKTEAPGDAKAAPEAAHEAAPKQKKKKAPQKKKPDALVARGKRKEAIARASISRGHGIIRFNSMSLDAMANRYVREIIREPLRYIGPEANGVDISVNVHGGGSMGQAQAARTAIANALVQYFPDMELKAKFVEIDRSLVIEDTRRVEPKKYRGPKARARFQKSYR